MRTSISVVLLFLALRVACAQPAASNAAPAKVYSEGTNEVQRLILQLGTVDTWTGELQSVTVK